MAPVGAYLVRPFPTFTDEAFTVAGGAVRRLSLLSTVGITDSALSVETIASGMDEIMTLTPDAGIHAVAAGL